jgi:hypothetical protein
MSLMKPPILQRGYDKANLFPVKRYAVMAERESVSRHRQPLHAPRFAPIEMNQGLLKQMPIQKAAPLSEASLRCFGQQSTSVRDGFPSTAIDLSGKTVCSAKGAASQIAVDFHSTEVQELDSIRLHQCPVVIDLGIVSSAEPLHRLQLVDHALDDQIQSVNLLKSSERNCDRHLGMDLAEALGTQSRREIVLINCFFTKTAQFVLRGISTTHHNLIKLVKLCVRQKPDRGVVKNRHSRQKWTKRLQFGKSDEGQRNGDRGINPRNLFPCPHSLVLILLFPLFAFAQPPQASLDAKHRAFLKDNCLTCHNAEKQKGKVRLDDIAFTLDSVEKADLWQKVLNSINSGEMPPEDEKQPDAAAKTDFLDDLSRTLVTARAALSDSGGKITMRRLNRREYKNTIRDLLGVDLRVNELPADGGAGTFDTVGSSLFMSSDQFEQYLALGRQALDEHFARFVMPTAIKPRLMHVEAEERNARIAVSLKERTDAHERHEKWTVAVNAAAAKPENAEIVAQIRAEKKGNATHLFFAWQRIKGAPSPADFGFTDAVHADEQGRRNWVHSVPQQLAYLAHPAAKTGSFLTIEDVFANPYQPFRIPGDWPAGDYVVRVRIAATSNTPKERHFVEFGSQHDTGVRAVTSSHQVTGTMEKPQVIEIPLKFSPVNGHGFFFQEKGSYESEEVAHRIFAEAKKRNGIGPEFALWIDWIEVALAGAPALTKTIKERREVELHANAMVGGTYKGYFKGGYEAAKKFMETKQPQKGILDEQEAKFRIRGFEQNGPTFERYLIDPLTKTGAYLTIYNVHKEEVITLPPDQPSGWLKTKHEVEKAEPGDYLLRFRIGAVKGTPKERHFVALGSRKAGDEDFTLMQTFQISGTTDAPQIIEVPVSLAADGPRTFVLREKRDVKLDHELFTTAQKATGVGPPSALWIDWVEWEGPMVKQAPIAKVERIEPEKRRADVERGHLRFKYLNEQYAKWKAAGGDEKRLKEFDFTDKSHAEFAKVVWDSNNRWFQQYLDRPLSKTGLYLDNTVQETCEHAIDLPADLATGDYVMRVKIGRVPDMPTERAFLSFVEASPIDKDDRTFLANKQITATLDQPEIIELPFQIRPSGPRKFILMEKRPLKKEAISLPGRTRQITDAKQRDPVLWIDWIEWQGPLNKAEAGSQVQPVIAAGETNPRTVLQTFAERAFRGKKPSAAFLDKLTALYDVRRKAGDAHEAALKEPLSVILASPGYLYIQEVGTRELGQRNKTSETHSSVPIPLSKSELASRLSYFLWSAPPDEALLKADLTKPDILAREVDRLIASPKADEFVSGFVHQWLGMDRLDFFQFDTKQFRDFDESAKAAARREVYETFAHLLRNSGSLTKLLKSDEIHVNGLLATYYGLEGISGDAFQKVKLPANSPRGGLLGMAAILAMGSNGERTSPVERGAWVLRKLLHNPPPPAPPNVPQLDRLAGKPISPRERLLAHQEEPQCLQCHRKIDPIGFGLENFNAAGKWRTEETFEKRGVGKKTWPIDPSGQFYNGPAFQDYFQLRDLIAAKSEDFARGFTEALIEYALGRPYGFTDAALADDIVKKAKAKDFSIREIIASLVTSREFGRK